jgi:hypothetical protein
MLVAAKAMARMALDLIEEPALLEAVRSEFRAT